MNSINPGKQNRIPRTTLLALLALVGQSGTAFQSTAQTAFLNPLIGKDLGKERLSDNTKARLQQMIGEVPESFCNGFTPCTPTPWRVWKTTGNRDTRFIILLGWDDPTIPGGSSACVVLLGSNLQHINRWCFQTGWRLYLNDASFEFSPALTSDLIVLHMAWVINGPHVTNEYFALTDDTLRFVRMENDKSEAVQNEYVYPNAEIGFVPVAKTVQEWVAMLQSPTKSEVLSALTFLGGRHIQEAQRRLLPEPTRSKYADFFLDLMSNDRVREIIAGLINSEDAWIRQAAKLASRGPEDRLM